MALSDQERAELLRLKLYFPFRTWFAVKNATYDAEYFDTKRKATNHARRIAPATIWSAQ